MSGWGRPPAVFCWLTATYLYTGYMSDTGLIVFLPLAGAVLGAIIGAWANSLYRNRERKQKEKEERTSLMFLIDTEVGFNAMRLEMVSKGPPSNAVPYLRTDVWDTSQARLAQLLPTVHMKKLAPYYEQIRMVKEFGIGSKESPRQVDDIEWDLIHAAQDWGFVVSSIAQLYVQDPEYKNPADIIAKDRNTN